MKKPFVKSNTFSDKLKIIIFILLCLSAFALISIPDDALLVFSSGDNAGAKSIIGLVNSWVQRMFIVFPRFRLRISFFAVPALLLMLWVEGASAFFVLMLSALAHECGHIFALHLLGYRVRRIDLLPMGALIVCPEGIPDRHEFIIAISGPAVSFAVAAVYLGLFCLLGGALLLYGGVINTALGFFNLLPVSKLDGGKALFSFLSYRKSESVQKICNLASFVSKALFATVAALCAVYSDFNLGVIILSVSLILQL